MIVSTTPCFPNNAVSLIAVRLQLIDPDLFVVKRPLRQTDPNQSIGVFASQWLPDEDSFEIKGTGFHDPTLEQYVLGIQGFVKDLDEQNGLSAHSVLSEMIRTILYRDSPLNDSLCLLFTDINGVHKRAKKWGIKTQRYFSNELSGNWLYLSTLEWWLDVEVT